MLTRMNLKIWLCLLLLAVPASAEYAVFTVDVGGGQFTLFRNPYKKDPLLAGAAYNHWNYDATGSPYPTADVEREFLAGMGSWNALSGTLWQFDASVLTPVGGVHDQSDAFHDLYWVNEPGTFLARANMIPATSDAYRGNGADVIFNSWHDFSFDGTPGIDEFDFQSVARHEVGHILGLGHNSEEAEVMYPFFDPGEVKQLGPQDAASNRYLYAGKLVAGKENVPASLTVGQSHDVRFYFEMAQNAVPTSSEFRLDVSAKGPASISIAGYEAADWQSVTLHAPGLSTERYNGAQTTTTDPWITGVVLSPQPGKRYFIDVRIQATAPGNVQVYYRANYLDPLQGFANGSCGFGCWFSSHKAFGDLDPLTLRPSGTALDQLGFASYVIGVSSVAPPNPSDLIVISPQALPSSVDPGAALTIEATVKNNGPSASQGSVLRYFLSNDATITRSDTELATDAIPGLASGATSPQSAGVTAPAVAEYYWVGACVDAANESDITNNCSAGIPIKVGEPPVPDLTIDSLSLNPIVVEPGDLFQISATVKNAGTEASQSSILRYYVSNDAVITPGDIEVATDPISGLPPAGTSPQSTFIGAPDTLGTYWIGACVDTVTDEVDTADNCGTPVKLQVKQVPAKAADFDGDGVSDWVIYRNGAWMYFGPCAHPLNVSGPALNPACSRCVEIVCAADSYCCNTFWDGICVDEVRSFCQ